MMRPHQAGAVICSVDPEGIGAKYGLIPGERIISINGQPLNDLIDYSYLVADPEIDLLVAGTAGEVRKIYIEKREDQGLGLEFEEAVFDGITPCANRCIFCFVDQMPKGQRASLYVKDDDYRLSFLQGSYITLTNLRDTDWKRLKQFHLSPLYVSVHATRSDVRQRLLGQARAGRIMEDLQRLGDLGIQCHTQAVLCPGINDGDVLGETLSNLFKRWPSVQTLAVVPVGLTHCREELPSLRKFSPDEALNVIQMVEAWQKHCLEKADTRWVWATDEFYIQAGLDLPPYEAYEDFEQLDNGVGLWRLMEREVEEAAQRNAARLKASKGSFGIVTGKDAIGFWELIREKMQPLAPDVGLDIYPVENGFFGQQVTVAGLVTGRDIINFFKYRSIPDEQIVLLPQVMIRHGESVFLDGTTVSQLQAAVDRRVEVVEVDGEEFVDAICQNPKEEKE